MVPWGAIWVAPKPTTHIGGITGWMIFEAPGLPNSILQMLKRTEYSITVVLEARGLTRRWGRRIKSDFERYSHGLPQWEATVGGHNGRPQWEATVEWYSREATVQRYSHCGLLQWEATLGGHSWTVFPHTISIFNFQFSIFNFQFSVCNFQFVVSNLHL